MKKFGSESNLAPIPNPKPIRVQRSEIEIKREGKVVGRETILIQHVSLHPYELLRR